MALVVDKTGRRYGRLTVIGQAPRKLGRTTAMWLCLCDCGTQKVLESGRLNEKRGTKSCGCLSPDSSRKRMTTHGGTYTGAYKSWIAMRRRCYEETFVDYDLYGARGIRVCDKWRNDFAAFFADMGHRPDGGTIERIDPEGNYAPDNCRWADLKEQARNRRVARRVLYRGQSIHIADFAESLGVPYWRVLGRIRRGWTPERIASTPKLLNGSHSAASQH
jgi:hypothetical protein